MVALRGGLLVLFSILLYVNPGQVSGTSYSAPFSGGKLLLGTWQQVVFLDFDTRPRERQVVLQFWGK